MQPSTGCLRQPTLAPFAHMLKTSATLLIIDDDDVVRASLAAYLEDSGFSVLHANNGLQGMELFEQEKPDLVICDLRMPQMGGLELIRQVTAIAPQTPVIVVSGAGVMSDAVEALRLGAADYLIKPLEDLAVLEHSVHRALDRARLLQENLVYRDKLEAANRELEASLHLLQEDQDAGRQVQMNMLPLVNCRVRFRPRDHSVALSVGGFRRLFSCRRAPGGVLPGRCIWPRGVIRVHYRVAQVHDHTLVVRVQAWGHVT
jgi:sigma-B regulation protein RsbU (phosphoserine phosphatase)